MRDPRFELSGAKLSKITQALACQDIQLEVPTPPRRATSANLELVRSAVEGVITDHVPTDVKVWKSLREKEVNRNVADFLWKAMHAAHKVGKYWDNIPNYEDRAQCPVCQGNPKESMEHILTQCHARPRRLIWQLCESLWKHKFAKWTTPTYGQIIGIGAVQNLKWRGCQTSGCSPPVQNPSVRKCTPYLENEM